MKTTSFSRAPSVLLVQLSRWEPGKGNAKKSFAPAVLPIRLNPVIFSPATEFDLVGFALHHGKAIACGHFTSVVSRGNDPAQWFSVNDEQVESCQLETVLADPQTRANVTFAVYRQRRSAHRANAADSVDVEMDEEDESGSDR